MYCSVDFVTGIDEVGVGCIAGNVTVCSVMFSGDCLYVPGINDSKKLDAKQRQYLFEQITDNCIEFVVAEHSPSTIDSMNIYRAVRDLYIESLDAMEFNSEIIVVDGLDSGIIVNQTKKLFEEPKADLNWYCVGAASIIAKHYRDQQMIELGKQYPEYGFESHKGYCTARHIAAVKKLGRIPGIHRRSFKFPYEKK